MAQSPSTISRNRRRFGSDRFRIDACCARSSRGFVPWTCRIRANRFTFASKTCRPEAALVVGRANVHFFQACQKCVSSFLVGQNRRFLHGCPHWSTYATALLDVAARGGVQQIVSLGAMLADLPHTRPPRVTGSSTDPRWHAQFEAWGMRSEE